MGRVDGKVALVTGAARGQGRSNAVRLAEEGADVVVLDACTDIDTVAYPLGTSEDLAETQRLVEATGRRCLSRVVDVRDQAALDLLVSDAVVEFGHLDIVSANAGIVSLTPTWHLSDDEWQNVLDVNLTGVFHTVRAVVPVMIEQGRGGAIVLTSSVAAIRASRNLGHYAASKGGVVSLMRALSNELGEHGIRVNTLNPGTVRTGMIENDAMYRIYRPDLESPTQDDIVDHCRRRNELDVPWVEAVDISNALVWLASDEARYVTGVVLPIDAGLLARA